MTEYLVKVDQHGEHPIATVIHNGRKIAEREINTLGHCMLLGRLLASPAAPRLPTLE